MTERVQSYRRVSSLFSSDDEDDPPSLVQSPKPSSALIYVREENDGVSHRGKRSRGTPASVGTTQGSTDKNLSTIAPEKKPWLLPERLVTSLSEKTTAHNKYPLFFATIPHRLDPSAKNFRAENLYISMLFLNIDVIMAIANETKSQ